MYVAIVLMSMDRRADADAPVRQHVLCEAGHSSYLAEADRRERSAIQSCKLYTFVLLSGKR